MDDIDGFHIRCMVGAHKQLAHALQWPVGHEAKYYLRDHEVVVRVVGYKRNRPVCAVVHWCQPPEAHRSLQPHDQLTPSMD